jgi:hypothetical protein
MGAGSIGVPLAAMRWTAIRWLPFANAKRKSVPFDAPVATAGKMNGPLTLPDESTSAAEPGQWTSVVPEVVEMQCGFAPTAEMAMGADTRTWGATSVRSSGGGDSPVHAETLTASTHTATRRPAPNSPHFRVIFPSC